MNISDNKFYIWNQRFALTLYSKSFTNSLYCSLYSKILFFRYNIMQIIKQTFHTNGLLVCKCQSFLRLKYSIHIFMYTCVQRWDRFLQHHQTQALWMILLHKMDPGIAWRHSLMGNEDIQTYEVQTSSDLIENCRKNGWTTWEIGCMGWDFLLHQCGGRSHSTSQHLELPDVSERRQFKLWAMLLRRHQAPQKPSELELASNRQWLSPLLSHHTSVS